jgi:hypothetical protein
VASVAVRTISVRNRTEVNAGKVGFKQLSEHSIEMFARRLRFSSEIYLARLQDANNRKHN